MLNFCQWVVEIFSERKQILLHPHPSTEEGRPMKISENDPRKMRKNQKCRGKVFVGVIG